MPSNIVRLVVVFLLGLLIGLLLVPIKQEPHSAAVQVLPSQIDQQIFNGGFDAALNVCKRFDANTLNEEDELEWKEVYFEKYLEVLGKPNGEKNNKDAKRGSGDRATNISF